MDREKVIKEFEHLLNAAKRNYQDFVDLTVDGGEEILAMLKENEAIEPDVDSEGTCTCGNCGENVGWYPVGSKEPVRLCKFCSECGHEVKWNG